MRKILYLTTSFTLAAFGFANDFDNWLFEFYEKAPIVTHSTIQQFDGSEPITFKMIHKQPVISDENLFTQSFVTSSRDESLQLTGSVSFKKIGKDTFSCEYKDSTGAKSRSTLVIESDTHYTMSFEETFGLRSTSVGRLLSKNHLIVNDESYDSSGKLVMKADHITTNNESSPNKSAHTIPANARRFHLDPRLESTNLTRSR